ncbi:sensor histidine kinase [Paucibacter soli]|uniref:sensor histidine kinase n=1 Tax=Paucibacter soli TaxID=3133433 RepID=UPI0030B7BC16
MATEPEINLVESGRERQTQRLRTKVYWSLFAVAMLAAAPGLLLAHGAAQNVLVIGALFLCLFVAARVTGTLMAPIEVLKRRLELRNYGDVEEDHYDQVEHSDVDLLSNSFEFSAMLASISPAPKLDMNMNLPAELVAIERQARAGRVSEIAVESVRRDLFRHLSHQLKSPLAMIKSHAEKAGNSVPEQGGEIARRELQSIASLCMNTSSLIEQMLALGYVGAVEEKGIGNQRANLSTEIMTLVRHRERLAADKRIVLDCNVEAGLWVRGLSALLQEMISSLVDNAIRYSPEDSKILVQAARLPGTKVISVIIQDQGPGIPESERERVFEPFYGSMGLDERGNMTFGTRRDRTLGAGVDKTSHGLGLALVKAVSKLHGASLTLESGPQGVGLQARIVMTSTEPPSRSE